MRYSLIIILVLVPQFLRAQLNSAWGFNAGLMSSTYRPNHDYGSIVSSPGYRFAFLLDKPLTHRLSLNAELGMQYIPDRPSPSTNSFQQLIYPELSLGATEYIPTGRGAMYLAVLGFIGYGFGQEKMVSMNGAGSDETNLYDQEGYQRFRAGMIFRIGYRFANGLFLESCLQPAWFSSYYRVPNSPVKYRETNVQIVNIGYLFGYRKRSRITR
jgi:hypothetical protein